MGFIIQINNELYDYTPPDFAGRPPNMAKLLNEAVRNYRRGKQPGVSLATVCLGCPFADFIQHIESQWQTGMSWANYGIWKRGEKMTWHIDHIKPQSLFNMTDLEDIKACFHYTNLQPLWAVDNISKSNKYAT